METIRKYLKPKYQDMTWEEIGKEIDSRLNDPKVLKEFIKGAKEVAKEQLKIQERAIIDPKSMNKHITI